MEKILILSPGNMPKSQKLFFLFMGFVFVLQGIINLYNNFTFLFLPVFYMVIGVVYILAILFYYKDNDRTPFIKLTNNEVVFKKSPLSKEVVLQISEINDLDITNYSLQIESNSKSHKISFRNLSYIQKKNDLPVFINEFNELRAKILLNKKAT